MTSIGLYVNVDLCDVMSEVSDDDILKEVERRCLEVARTVEAAKSDTFTPLVQDALELLAQGRADDARLTLERALFPKWKSPEESMHRLAIARKAS